MPEKELRTAAKEGRFEDEGWRVRKDGTRFWANAIISALRDKDGALRGFAKVTRDLTERRQAEERIQQQSKEIMELSTPVMQVWQGVVVAPLIGSLDSQRTQQFMERLLTRVVETNSPVALVDIMGVPTIDTQTAQHLIETISAVRLLGAQVVLDGRAARHCPNPRASGHRSFGDHHALLAGRRVAGGVGDPEPAGRRQECSPVSL